MRRFVYRWYHAIAKDKVYEAMYLFALFKIQHMQIKVACQNNVFTASLYAKRFKVFFTGFYISVRESIDCIKN